MVKSTTRLMRKAAIAAAVLAIPASILAYSHTDLKGAESRQRNTSTNRMAPGRQTVQASPGEKAPAYSERAFRAAVLAKDSWIQSGQWESGIYEYPLSGYQSRCIVLDQKMDPTGGATSLGDRFFWTVYEPNPYSGVTTVDHYLSDTGDWTTYTSTTGNVTGIARDLAWDKTNGKVYGIFKNADGTLDLGRLDPNDIPAGRTTICHLTEKWEALAVDNYGRLYAITASGDLVKVDKATGKTTLIGSTGLTTKYQTSGAIDPETNRFYYCPSNDEHANMYSISLEDASKTVVYEMTDGEQLAGLHFPVPATKGGVPARVKDEDITPMFYSGYDGRIIFRTPATTHDGTAASGSLDWSVKCNGKEYASGKTQHDLNVMANISGITEPGLYTFIITTSNSEGTSPEAYCNVYLGPDAPETIKAVKIDAIPSLGRYIISWDAPQKGANGTTINPDDITYNVVRNPGGVVISSGSGATQVLDSPEDNGKACLLYYEVTPVHKGMEGNTTVSDKLIHGATVPPYSVDFTDMEARALLTIVDNNNDNRYFWDSTDRDGEKCLYLYPTSVADGDDYIFSEPLRLKKGVTYNFSAILAAQYAQWGGKEQVDFVLATSPAADGVVSKFEDNATITAKAEYTKTFTVDTDGVYYVGIHGRSPADTFGLYAYGMSVMSGAVDDAPAAPALTATRTGKNIDIRITVPRTTIAGEELEAISDVRLYRNDTEIKSFGIATPGSELTWIEQDLADGLYVYRCTATNEAGEGAPAESRAFIGVNVPGAPANFEAKALPDNESVTLSWDAPALDRDGCPIDASDVTYTPCWYNDNTLAWSPIANEPVTGTSYTFKAHEGAGQSFFKFAIFAQSRAGKNEADFAEAPAICVGTPYDMPYIETFGGTSLTGVLGEENETAGAGWQIMYTKDQDGTGGCILYTGSIDKKGALMTGRINITGDKPTFSFWYWSIPTSPEGETISVEVNDGDGYKEVAQFPMNRGGNEQHWEKATVDISQYIGKPVQFKIVYMPKAYVLYIDNIRVVNDYDDNLSARELVMTTHTTPGMEVPVSFTIENTGNNTSRAYTVKLLCNGDQVDGIDMEPLGPGKRAVAEMSFSLGLFDPEACVVQAVIDYDDQCADDNAGAETGLVLILPDVPAVKDLRGKREGTDAVLAWDMPEAGAENQTVTESAERCIPFSTGLGDTVLDNDFIGDWLMVNADNDGSAGLLGFEHPNITADAALSFIVFNPGELGIVNSHWMPRTGKNMFACLVASSGTNDDWMISPELSGKSQTVSFYARSTAENYNEEFEFLTSAGSTETTGFQLVEKVTNVPDAWTKYTFDIPGGTKRFAIRCVSNRQLALLVDDITFERKNPNLGREPLAYNVYRDGAYVDRVTTPAFNETISGERTYNVTALYSSLGGSHIESAGAKPVTVPDVGGIDRVNGHEIIISGAKGAINVLGAEGLRIFVVTIDGRVVSATTATGDACRIPAAPGVYVVRAGGASAKVLVK